VDPLSISNPSEVIAARTAAIHEAALRRSRYLKAGNFEEIAPEDLELLFGGYDERFFDGWLAETVKEEGRLEFRLSSRMTRAGGKTTRYDRRGPGGRVSRDYEIAIACQMLFMTFHDVQRPVTVCGLTCTDRLEALQRIFEHEIIHLTEMLAWGRSSCRGARFRTLASNTFGHTDTRHGLVTPREQAAVRHGVQVGGIVAFEYEGRRLVGRVNRIRRRATVLVPDADGAPYSDGGTYAKYYVPIAWLRPLAADDTDPE